MKLTVYVCLAPLLAGMPQPVEMSVTLHDTTFTVSEPLQLTCTEGLSLSGEMLSDDGKLTPTYADSDRHELRVILSAFATLTDTFDSSLCHEVTMSLGIFVILTNICDSSWSLSVFVLLAYICDT